MSDSTPKLPHGELPPIPEGCGILPVAENRIAPGPHPELLDQLPEGFVPHLWMKLRPLPTRFRTMPWSRPAAVCWPAPMPSPPGFCSLAPPQPGLLVDPTVPPGPLEWLTALSAPVRCC